MAFADHYPLDMFVAAAAIHKNQKAVEKAGGQASIQLGQEHRTAIFGAAFIAHLTQLREEGRLGLISGLKGRQIWLATAWNNFVSGGKLDVHLPRVIGFRPHVGALVSISYQSILGSREKHADLDETTLVERNWDALCKMIDAGTTSTFDWAIDDLRDATNGDRCEIRLINWQPQLMIISPDHKARPAGDIEPIALVSAEFDMPSGHLLLTDTIRLPGFSDATEFEPNDEYGKYSLDNELGRALRIGAHAEQHGFGYAQTTNTCVVVHRHPDTHSIMVSERWNHDEQNDDADGDAAAPGWEKIGTFSCDIWRITAIDQRTAANLMSAGGFDPQKSETVLASYLASDDVYAENIVRLEVTPGRWRIHAGPDFNRRVDRDRFGIPSHIRPWIVLEKTGQ